MEASLMGTRSCGTTDMRAVMRLRKDSMGVSV